MNNKPDPTNAGSAGRSGPEEASAEQVKAGAKAVQERAGAAADEATREVKETASEIGATVKDGASAASERLRRAAAEQKDAGAERLDGIADAINRAADELGQEVPQVAEHVRRVARELETVSEALRERDLRDLVGVIQDFARRHPAAFLGATLLAGFAAVRLLKVSKSPQRVEPAHQSGPRGTTPPTRPQEGPAPVSPASGTETTPPIGSASPGVTGSPGTVPGGREPSSFGTSNL